MNLFKIEVRIAEDTTTDPYPKRFDTYTNSVFLTYLTPINIFDSTIQKNKVENQVFYKKTINEKITVTGSEYQALKDELAYDCRFYWVNVSVLCDGEYVFKNRFYFRNNNLSFDFDRCTCDIQLQVTSIYDSIEQNKNTKFKFASTTYTFDNFLPDQYKISDLCSIANDIIIRMNSGGYENDVVGRLECAISDFFNWQINTGPTYAGNITTGVVTDTQQIGGPGFTYLSNYVNPGQDSYFIGIGIKSNIIDPNASNPATLFNLSFTDLETILREVFNVYWIIEETILFTFPSIGTAIRYIRFEHFSWFQKNVNYDSTSATNFPLNRGKNKFEGKKIEEIGSEVWELNDNNHNSDFEGNPIVYPSCTGSTKIRERGTSLVSVDFESIQLGVYDNNDNYVLFDLTFTLMAPPRTILLRNDTINGTAYYNGRMSLYDLLEQLHKHNRPYKTGTINAVSTTFLSPVYSKIQENILVKNCCDVDFDPKESLVKTEIGDGEILEQELNYRLGQIKFKTINE